VFKTPSDFSDSIGIILTPMGVIIIHDLGKPFSTRQKKRGRHVPMEFIDTLFPQVSHTIGASYGTIWDQQKVWE
jgi:hypothetical protein